MSIKERVLRKADDDSRYIFRTGRRSLQIELGILNALLQKANQDFLPMPQALLHEAVAKLEICLKDLMATCRAVDNIGGRTVLRQDHCLDSLSSGSLSCSSILCKGLRVFMKLLETSNKQVFLPLPIQVDRGARQSGFFCDVADRGPAIPEIAEPLDRCYENSLSRVFGFRPSRLFHRINDATFP